MWSEQSAWRAERQTIRRSRASVPPRNPRTRAPSLGRLHSIALLQPDAFLRNPAGCSDRICQTARLRRAVVSAAEKRDDRTPVSKPLARPRPRDNGDPSPLPRDRRPARGGVRVPKGGSTTHLPLEDTAHASATNLRDTRLPAPSATPVEACRENKTSCPRPTRLRRAAVCDHRGRVRGGWRPCRRRIGP